jgi:hypothetical protein
MFLDNQKSVKKVVINHNNTDFKFILLFGVNFNQFKGINDIPAYEKIVDALLPQLESISRH